MSPGRIFAPQTINHSNLPYQRPCQRESGLSLLISSVCPVRPPRQTPPSWRRQNRYVSWGMTTGNSYLVSAILFIAFHPCVTPPPARKAAATITASATSAFDAPASTARLV